MKNLFYLNFNFDMHINKVNLIKGALFSVKMLKTMPTKSVPASKTDRAPRRGAKLAAAHRTIEVVRPLRRLNWHSKTITKKYLIHLENDIKFFFCLRDHP